MRSTFLMLIAALAVLASVGQAKAGNEQSRTNNLRASSSQQPHRQLDDLRTWLEECSNECTEFNGIFILTELSTELCVDNCVQCRLVTQNDDDSNYRSCMCDAWLEEGSVDSHHLEGCYEEFDFTCRDNPSDTWCYDFVDPHPHQRRHLTEAEVLCVEECSHFRDAFELGTISSATCEDECVACRSDNGYTECMCDAWATVGSVDEEDCNLQFRASCLVNPNETWCGPQRKLLDENSIHQRRHLVDNTQVCIDDCNNFQDANVLTTLSANTCVDNCLFCRSDNANLSPEAYTQCMCEAWFDQGSVPDVRACTLLFHANCIIDPNQPWCDRGIRRLNGSDEEPSPNDIESICSFFPFLCPGGLGRRRNLRAISATDEHNGRSLSNLEAICYTFPGLCPGGIGRRRNLRANTDRDENSNSEGEGWHPRRLLGCLFDPSKCYNPPPGCNFC